MFHKDLALKQLLGVGW